MIKWALAFNFFPLCYNRLLRFVVVVVHFCRCFGQQGVVIVQNGVVFNASHIIKVNSTHNIVICMMIMAFRAPLYILIIIIIIITIFDILLWYKS